MKHYLNSVIKLDFLQHTHTQLTYYKPIIIEWDIGWMARGWRGDGEVLSLGWGGGEFVFLGNNSYLCVGLTLCEG